MSFLRSVLVTGATGFIGRALVARLVREGAEVHCVVRKSTRNDALEGLVGVRMLPVDSFTGRELDDALAGLHPDVVYNLASYGVRPDDRDPRQMMEGNIGVVTGMLLAVAKCSARRFIQIGSCSEYGRAEDGHLMDEGHAIAPMSLYGAAKATSVIYGDALARQLGVAFVTLRLFGVYGVGEAPYRLIPYLMDRLERDEPVDLTPGEQVRDLLYIDDVIDALLVAARIEDRGARRLCNVCSGAPLKVRAIAETVCETMGKPGALLRFGQRPYRPDEWMWIVGDNRRFCGQTDWLPRVSLREGLRRMAAARAQAKAINA
jgi:UDP-glucose 4-epimerase